jgi:hypothetical protein
LTIREAVITWIKSLPGLVFLVPRVTPDDPSQTEVYPCVTVQVTAREYGRNLSGADGTSTATVEITALADTEAQAISIAEVIRDNFDGFRGNQSGVPIGTCHLDDESDGSVSSPDGGDLYAYFATLEYRIKHRVSLPASVTQTNI